MRIAREEVFGPGARGHAVLDEDEAIRLANDTPYGLAAGVWTRDVQRAHRVAHAHPRRDRMGQLPTAAWRRARRSAA